LHKKRIVFIEKNNREVILPYKDIINYTIWKKRGYNENNRKQAKKAY
jgi:hypothetical protein